MFPEVLYEATKATLVEYLNKTSLNGCYLLYSIRKRKYQRLVWFSFIIMTVGFATYVCATVLTSFLRDPIVTTLDSQMHSVYEKPFPAVAVCSYNKFSRQALWSYAANLTLRSETNQTLRYWLKRLEILSGLYNYDSINFKESEDLHIELENILGEKFAISKILKMLAPSCEDLLVKCFWAGEIINCKQQFELKMFLDGPCCVFNYQYRRDLDTLHYPKDTGPDTGLAFLVNSSTNDYFYAEGNAVGCYVKLFSTQFIPDMRLGELEEFHVGVAEDLTVHLRLVSQDTSQDTRFYSVHKRRCYFPYEQGQSAFEKSECILKCQVRRIGQNCDCVPFYVANSDIEGKSAADECSLMHLGCLAFFKYELLDSSECVDCYPLCSYSHYWYRKTVNSLNDKLWTWNNPKYLHSINITPDVSLVRISYASAIAVKYKKKVLYNWSQILSHIGGVMGICMGCSIINGIEIVYFSCYRFIENLLRLQRS